MLNYRYNRGKPPSALENIGNGYSNAQSSPSTSSSCEDSVCTPGFPVPRRPFRGNSTTTAPRRISKEEVLRMVLEDYAGRIKQVVTL